MDFSKNDINDLVQSREVHDVRRVERFVPEVLMQKIIDGSWRATPTVERRTGAVMMADISGYTKLTEQLSTSTGAGYESLVASLNRYFDKISEEIYAHGGDVIKFAGDALLVAFYTTEVYDSTSNLSNTSSNT
jgi:class 3 adenylate cyclase